jgi:hypothetical protein
MKSATRVLLPLLAAGLAACAATAVVFVSHTYDPQHVRRVAVLSFTDYPGAQGSGELAAGTLEKYLLWADYSLIERRQVQQVLNEQSFQVSDAVDPATISKVGKILGVDALVLGGLTDFTNTREQTVMVDEPQENTTPLYGTIETTQRAGATVVRTTQQVVTGYQTSATDQVVPEVETFPAHVGMSVRLVDVATAELLWSASAASDGADPASATEQASAALMQGVVAQLKKSARPPR